MPSAARCALDINDDGQLAGAFDVEGHGVLRDRRGNFTTIDHPDGVAETVLTGINNRGQIVGGYLDATGTPRSIRRGLTAAVATVSAAFAVAGPLAAGAQAQQPAPAPSAPATLESPASAMDRIMASRKPGTSEHLAAQAARLRARRHDALDQRFRHRSLLAGTRVESSEDEQLHVIAPPQRSGATRVMVMIQLVSQVLPSSGEKACSQRAPVRVMFDHVKRTRIGRPSSS
jgi:hypothetical protein